MSPSADTMVSIIVYSIEWPPIVDHEIFVQPMGGVFSSAEILIRIDPAETFWETHESQKLFHFPARSSFAFRFEDMYDHETGMLSTSDCIARICFDETPT